MHGEREREREVKREASSEGKRARRHLRAERECVCVCMHACECLEFAYSLLNFAGRQVRSVFVHVAISNGE